MTIRVRQHRNYTCKSTLIMIFDIRGVTREGALGANAPPFRPTKKKKKKKKKKKNENHGGGGGCPPPTELMYELKFSQWFYFCEFRSDVIEPPQYFGGAQISLSPPIFFDRAQISLSPPKIIFWWGSNFIEPPNILVGLRYH